MGPEEVHPHTPADDADAVYTPGAVGAALAPNHGYHKSQMSSDLGQSQITAYIKH